MQRARYGVALAVIAIAGADSEKRPSGHLWGWLLDEHAVAGQDVAQKGPWYWPPFAVKAR